ncbi:hypothetical protein SNE40_017010 [Patella caerulea]|uniref:Coiled-coil domain-containing protein 169 n=1 Tax=Patella caerulea TaxID=87958 RepID=A0AAN8JD22_PATCE
MAVDLVEEYELEKIRSEINQERQMKEMLEQSAEELQTTVEELEKRFDAIENEGNEWKTRFETQTEMNQQLERQILMLENKVEESKKNLRDEMLNKPVGKSPQGGKLLEDLADANPQMVKALEKDKMSLMNQIRDLEWRLDQESKAYHRANDERKQYVIEINSTKGSIYHLQRQRAAGDATYRTPREQGGNIPDDQRILDPKKGPIRKTAAVKSLPSLDHI